VHRVFCRRAVAEWARRAPQGGTVAGRGPHGEGAGPLHMGGVRRHRCRPQIDRVTWPALFYAVLSLTVVRMLPVFLCLIGSRSSTADKLFIGWFGPRGLATNRFRNSRLGRKAAR